MKTKIFKLFPILLFLLPFCLILPGPGCDKTTTEDALTEEICNYETTETDPEALIIGRWELYKANDRLVDKNDPGDIEYREFGLDSIAKIQNIVDGDLYTISRKYWVDSLLHYNIDGGFPYTPWYYDFTDNCTLKLVNAFPAFTSMVLIFKRTEQ